MEKENTGFFLYHMIMEGHHFNIIFNQGPLESDPKDLQMSMVRVIQGGIILDVRSGRDIVKWLTEKLDTLEKLKSGKSSNKK